MGTEVATMAEDPETDKEPEIMPDLAKEVVSSKDPRAASSKILRSFTIVQDNITSRLGRNIRVKAAITFSPPMRQGEPGS